MYKFKFYIYSDDKLVFDSQQEHDNEFLSEIIGDGLYEHDDVAWDMASEAIFCLFNITANEDSCYRTEVEEIEVEDYEW